MITEGAEEARETFTVAVDMVARPVAMDTLRARLAATMSVETRGTGCRKTHTPLLQRCLCMCVREKSIPECKENF